MGQFQPVMLVYENPGEARVDYPAIECSTLHPAARHHPFPTKNPARPTFTNLLMEQSGKGIIVIYSVIYKTEAS